MTTNEFVASLPVIMAVIGPVGSLIEWIGNTAKVEPIAQFGRVLEAVGVDLPKHYNAIVGVIRSARPQ